MAALRCFASAVDAVEVRGGAVAGGRERWTDCLMFSSTGASPCMVCPAAIAGKSAEASMTAMAASLLNHRKGENDT